MEWIQLMSVMGLFCCIGMMQQQEPFADMKRNFNFTYALFVMHQRALTVPFRKYYGVNALGVPCALAFVLMLVWATASNDPFMFLWIGAWLFCQLVRRWESVRLYRKGAPIHTQYDGYPALRFGSENTRKMIGEPLMFGLFGLGLLGMYQDCGMPVQGLPYFFLAGVVTLPFVEIVKRTIWERRTQAMADARIEQEQVVSAYRNRFGE